MPMTTGNVANLCLPCGVTACIGIAVSVLEWLTEALKVYLLPAVLGALSGRLALRGPVYAIPAITIAVVPILLGFALLERKGIAPRID